MKGTTDLSIITKRCLRLNETLMNMFGSQIPTCKPSCSIGVALLPNHANTYLGLFCCADRALYYEEGTSCVYILQGGRVRRKVVEVIGLKGDEVLLHEDSLPVGAQVIITDIELTDGMILK
jgi:predicted signal transduction protein with EAL and GGDEF domain